MSIGKLVRAIHRPAGLLLLSAIIAATGVGCEGGVSQPQYVVGVEPIGNEPPTLTILRPSEDISISRGAGIVIEWIDTDRDDSATISFSLIDINDPNGEPISLVDNLDETPDGPDDRYTAFTRLVPEGSYTLRGQIDDHHNRLVTAVAMNRTAGLGEVIIRVVSEGQTSISNLPPQIFVRDPAFNLSVSQDDTVTIVIQPTFRDPNQDAALGTIIDDAYDADSNTLLYIALDLDGDPLNDDVIAPEPDKLILLVGPEEIAQGASNRREFPITIDLAQVPLRLDGAPYRIRATITDGQNPPVHRYAEGTLNVVRAVSAASAGEAVDLGLIGSVTAGVRFVGFNPGSHLGTKMVNIRDFDLDGIDDFCLVARHGNPRNFGNIGEAYVIYGLPGQRFGGTINVNSTAKSIPGFILEAPPPRGRNASWRCGGFINVADPRTEGITDVAFIPDLDGDGRPELLIGTAHVDGYFQTRDDDPGDDPPTAVETIDVELDLVHGNNESLITIEAEPDDIVINFTYPGTHDVVISSAEPNRNFRSGDLEWVNEGPGNQKWTLIKLDDPRTVFPPEDTPDVIADIDAELTLTVLSPGGPATIHQLYRDFDEITETYSSFGLPVEGVDYDEEELATINADESATEIRVDLTQLLQQLLFGLLAEYNNEIRLIIVPGDILVTEEAADEGSLASKEFADVRQRPTLNITYDRELAAGPLGCYPDVWPNNFADEADSANEGCNERKFEAGGFVTVLSSTNRDAAARLDPDRLSEVLPDRLTNTVVSLELVGMRPTWTLGFGINAEAQATGEEDNRIAGARIQAGMYDFFDHLFLEQPPLEGLFGMSVAYMPDVDLDGFPEVVISSPTNEADHLFLAGIPNSTHWWARQHVGSITIIPGTNYDVDLLRDKPGAETGTSCNPWMRDLNANDDCDDPGDCGAPPTWRCGPEHIDGTWEIFAEDPSDYLGGARSPGDFNLDSITDLMCGAPLNDWSESQVDTGTMYIIYGRSPIGDVRLIDADNPYTRPPMLRIHGLLPGDQIGWKQEPVTDVNGDGIDDVLFSSPKADFRLPPPKCLDKAEDLCGPEAAMDGAFFNVCFGQREVFMDLDGECTCKIFDFNNDRVVDIEDRDVFNCLQTGGDQGDCCPVDNGYVGIVFGGVTRQGDRGIDRVGTADLAGVIFYGDDAGDRAGYDISSAGDFDNDGFGDILISAPGKIYDQGDALGVRMGMTYLVYGGPHLENQEPIQLSEIGTRVPGLKFVSPYLAGPPDEAPTDGVGFIGDINNDGFGDIAIGCTMADLLDVDFPQGEGTPNETGRRPDQGDIYIIYGNNIGR